MTAIQYYLPRLSDIDLHTVCRFAGAQFLKAEEAGEDEPFYYWLFASLHKETDRRKSLDNDEPVDVELMQLPDWTGDELGQALIRANHCAMLSWPKPVGEFIDQIVLSINVRAARVLRKTR